MGGGPRTYPGGVSKWQWKRMQAKKAKQLLKARLCRERQIYEMRKRAELRAAVSELERPWEVVERAPNLFSVSADEQVKVLADRFQKPGGFDLWSDKDGPLLFPDSVNRLPSARFFPKGVVHSIKPYQRIEDSDGFGEIEGDSVKAFVSEGEIGDGLVRKSGGDENLRKFSNEGFGEFDEMERKGYVSENEFGSGSVKEINGYKNPRRSSNTRLRGNSIGDKELSEKYSRVHSSGIDGRGRRERGNNGGKFRSRKRPGSLNSGIPNGNGFNSQRVGIDKERRGKLNSMPCNNDRHRQRNGLQMKDFLSETYDMSLQQDGSYEFNEEY
ncbi:hypothetical protein RJ641_028424 [Dillenia turbinata]|uniref:DEAD-box ATP-dependent RNA helicase 48 n=1 Tax=Dillenia turbinata TaxID=194707 RepID=A0AAN8WBZ6_9MAGN